MKTYLVHRIFTPFYQPFISSEPQPVLTLEWENETAAVDICALETDEDYDYRYVETDQQMENHFTSDDLVALGLGY